MLFVLQPEIDGAASWNVYERKYMRGSSVSLDD